MADHYVIQQLGVRQQFADPTGGRQQILSIPIETLPAGTASRTAFSPTCRRGRAAGRQGGRAAGPESAGRS
jgi:hypothetical protein